MVQRLVAARKGAKQVTSELTNAAFFTAKQGKSDELGRRLLALVEPTRREAGCVRYDIYRSNDDPDAWFVYEDWRAIDDFSAHMQTPYVQSFMADVPVLCATDVEICAYSRMSPQVLTR
jgi:quinol monooxygenase YgiN